MDAGVFEKGRYSFKIKVKDSPFHEKGVFNVLTSNLEDSYTVADHNFLRLLAQNSGGKIYASSDIDNLVNEINSSYGSKKQIIFKENAKGIINFPWILLILLLLASCEWVVRKYNGLA